ncbi:glycosyltransferase, partial [Candidatus Hydrogenedentota bacterium]
MKILMTATSCPPAIGGGQTYTKLLARGLNREHDVSILGQWSGYRTDWLLGTTVFAPGNSAQYECGGVPIRTFGLRISDKLAMLPFALPFHLTKGFSIPAITRIMGRRLGPLAGSPDLIHNMRIGRESLSYASLKIARGRGVPFVFTPFHHPRWEGWTYRHFIRLYRQADAIITMTPYEKEKMVELGVMPERIHVTGVGPDVTNEANPEKFRAQHKIDGHMVLFVGQHFRYKGFETLMRSALAVWKRHPETSFV